MSYVRRAALDTTFCITDARLLARLSVSQCLELCDVSERTWRRWMHVGAPVWAVRLVLSQRATLDRFGWKAWEIRGGCLYNNQLSHRYYWTPAKLLLPLYGITDHDIPWSGLAANLSSLDCARRQREEATAQPSRGLASDMVPSKTAHNV